MERERERGAAPAARASPARLPPRVQWTAPGHAPHSGGSRPRGGEQLAKPRTQAAAPHQPPAGNQSLGQGWGRSAGHQQEPSPASRARSPGAPSQVTGGSPRQCWAPDHPHPQTLLFWGCLLSPCPTSPRETHFGHLAWGRQPRHRTPGLRSRAKLLSPPRRPQPPHPDCHQCSQGARKRAKGLCKRTWELPLPTCPQSQGLGKQPLAPAQRAVQLSREPAGHPSAATVPAPSPRDFRAPGSDPKVCAGHLGDALPQAPAGQSWGCRKPGKDKSRPPGPSPPRRAPSL